MADDGKLVKQDEDYTSQVDDALPVANALAVSGGLNEAIEHLLPLEKKARIASDATSTARLTEAIVQLCFDAKNWDALNDNLVLLSKRRGQLKQAVTKMVQRAMQFLDQTPDKATLLKLIDTLRTITAGKIHVEVERARVTLRLSKLKEADGLISEAAEILHELQVETYGSMERREKIEIILEQMRLGLAKKDFIRTQIISKKISKRFFEEANTEELKLSFYSYMLSIAEHDASYLDMCLYYKEIYDTPVIQKDEDKWKETLQNIVMYVLLSSHDNQQSDLLNRIAADKKLQELPLYSTLVTKFLTNEIMFWRDVEAGIGPVLLQTPVFSGSSYAEKRWVDFRKRVVEHNLRVVAKFYTRVNTKRLLQLLDLSELETEEFITSLVVSKTIYAKIDRLAGVVTFNRPADPEDILNNWAHSIKDLMGAVDTTTHLINKERMVHKV